MHFGNFLQLKRVSELFAGLVERAFQVNSCEYFAFRRVNALKSMKMMMKVSGGGRKNQRKGIFGF